MFLQVVALQAYRQVMSHGASVLRRPAGMPRRQSPVKEVALGTARIVAADHTHTRTVLNLTPKSQHRLLTVMQLPKLGSTFLN